MYRLFLDYPITASSNEEAVSIANKIIEMSLSEDSKEKVRIIGIEQVNYRLGNDEDRQNRNYFIIDESGHASTKKIKVSLQPFSE